VPVYQVLTGVLAASAPLRPTSQVASEEFLDACACSGARPSPHVRARFDLAVPETGCGALAP